MKTYRGVEGVSVGDLKQCQAIDGLIALLSEVNDWPVGEQADGRFQDISVVGRYSRCKNLDAEGQPEFGLWRLAEVDFVWRGGSGPGVAGGSSVMACEPSSLGLLRACEEYLEEFHTPPYRPDGWTSDIDEKADAEWRLREVWEPEPVEEKA